MSRRSSVVSGISFGPFSPSHPVLTGRRAEVVELVGHRIRRRAELVPSQLRSLVGVFQFVIPATVDFDAGVGVVALPDYGTVRGAGQPIQTRDVHAGFDAVAVHLDE